MNLEIDGTKKILLVEESQGLTLNTETNQSCIAIAGVSEKGPQGDRGLSGIVSVTTPITNSGTESAANIGIIVGSGGVADHAAVQSALATKLNSSTAASTYLTITNAASTYLTQANAASIYLTKNNASSTYLTQSSAELTYLTISDASATYVSLSDPRLTNARTPTDGSVTSAKIAAGGLSPSTITGTAVVTNDSRLSDSRTPLAHTHTISDITDAGTAASKNVGTGSNQVAAGDDPRIVDAVLKTPSSSQTITNNINGVIPLSINQSSQNHGLQTTLSATSGNDITALNVVSYNPDSSAVWISGKEYGHGTLKVAHLQPSANSDANAAAISINLASDATRAADTSTDDRTATQGIFLDSYQTPSSGLKVNIVNGSNIITLANDNVNPISSTAIDKYIICTGFTSATKVVSINGNEITLSNSCTSATQNGVYAVIRYGTKGKLLYLRNGGNDKLILTADGQLQLPATNDASPSTRGITIGGDTNLYRQSANLLSTGSNDSFVVGQTLQIGSDTNLYRSAANTLKTDDDFVTDGNITTLGELRFVDDNTKFYRSSTNPYTIRTNNQLYLFNTSATFDALALNWGAAAGSAAFTIKNNGKIQWGNGGGSIPENTGPDTNLYRDSAGVLKTDNNLTVNGTLQIGSDTNLYRSSANVLKTDDAFTTGSHITTLGELRFVDDNTKFYRSSIDPYTIRTNNQLYLFNNDENFDGLALNWGNSNGSAAFVIQNNGRIEWGPGNNSGSRDVYIHRDGANTLSVNGKFQVSATPTSNNDVVRKSDLDNVASGLNIKAPVRVATNANISTLAGQLTVNPGVTVTTGDRILVKDQNTQSQNGIYVVGASPSYTWTRATDMDTDWSEVKGAYTLVLEGTEANTGYIFNGASAGTIGSTAITFVKFTTTTSYSAQTGGGLALSGTQFYIDSLGVTNAMLFGNIDDSKLSTITSSGKVANSATTASTGNANPASTIVAKDSSGNFTANNITANLIGNADTATNITSGTTTLASNVVNSSITKISPLSSGTAGFVKIDNVGNLTSAGSIVNADINASAAISYSKLSLAGSITNNDLAGSIANNKLANSSITINGSAIALGGSIDGLLTTSDALTTYLTQTNAASTYLTQTNAASTYLTQTNASSTYAPKASPTFTGTITTSLTTGGFVKSAATTGVLSNGSIVVSDLPSPTNSNNTSTNYPSQVVYNDKGQVVSTTAATTTGSGSLVFATSPTISSPTLSNTVNVSGLTASQFVKTDSSKNLTSATIASTDLPSVFIGTTSVALSRSSGSQTLNGVSIDGNAGTVTNGFYTTSSFNLGTTSIAVNRASGSQSLTGVSIDGNAGTVTNGVYTNANNTFTGINTFNGGVRTQTRTFNNTTVGASDTITSSDYTIYYYAIPAAGLTTTLPAASASNIGQIFNIKNGTIIAITINGGGTNIDGNSTYLMPANAQYQNITVQCVQTAPATYMWAII